MRTNRTWILGLAPTLLIGGLAGCGDGTTGSGATGGGGGGSSTSGGGGAGGTGGSPDGGSGTGANGAGGSGGGIGGSGGGVIGADNRVLLTVFNRIPSPGYAGALGFYVDNTGALPGEDCHIEVDGPCLVLQCGVDGDPTSGVDLGQLELHVGEEEVFSYDPNALGLYNDGTPIVGAQWSTGEAISVTGTNGDVDDFSFDFEAPPSIALVGDLEGASVSRAAPLTLEWEPSEAAEVFMARLFQSSTVDGNYVLVSAYCTFPAADGAGEIPTPVLERFGNGLVGLLFGGAAHETIPGLEHTIEILAYKGDGVDFDFTD